MNYCSPHYRGTFLQFKIQGLNTTFWQSIYPTTFIFTQTLSKHKWLPGLASISVGLGAVFGGRQICAKVLVCTIFTLLSKRYKNIGTLPSLYTCVATLAMAYVLIFLSTPNYSSIVPNDEPAFYLKPRYSRRLQSIFRPQICIAVAFLLGIAEGAIGTLRAVLCSTLYPNRRAEAFSISKLYQVRLVCFFLHA